MQRSRALKRTSALERATALQRTRALLRTGSLLRTLARNARVSLLRTGRALRLLGLSLLGRRWLGLRLFRRLRLRRCRHQQCRRCRNTLRPKCNFSHMDQLRRRGTPPLQPEFECLPALGPLLTEAGPTQADRQNTELHTASQDLGGSQGIGRGSAVFNVGRPKSPTRTGTYTIHCVRRLEGRPAVVAHSHSKINCSVNAENEMNCI